MFTEVPPVSMHTQTLVFGPHANCSYLMSSSVQRCDGSLFQMAGAVMRKLRGPHCSVLVLCWTRSLWPVRWGRTQSHQQMPWTANITRK